MSNIRVLFIDDMAEAKEEIRKIGADESGINLMAPKAVHRLIKIENLRSVAANMLKQEMLSKGGEAAITRGAANFSVESSDVILMGTVKQYRELINKLKMQAFGLPKLAEKINAVLHNLENHKPITLDCRGKTLRLGERTLVMGILNVTPDSFSDGGKFYDIEAAITQAHRMVEDGADIIDLGAVSTKPGYVEISSENEASRFLPVLKRLVKEIEVPISIDTWRADTARWALEEGAHIVNDQWAFRADNKMAAVCAEYNVPVVLMHNQEGTDYNNLMEDILAFLQGSLNIGIEAGVLKKNMIIDPGIGFGKTLEQNLECMNKLKELKTLGQGLLLGTSRKSMIGKVLDLPTDQRIEGTAATIALGIAYGADIVRVHDVKEMVRVVRMTDAMVRQ